MSQTFPITPAGAGPLVLLAVVVVILLGTALAVGRSVVASRTARFVVTDSTLAIRGDWWGRELPRDALRIDEARAVDLRAEPSLQPTSRRFGSGLPGYAGGWFRLRNGERALVYLTDRRRAVVVPTQLGYTLVLSPADPEGFLAALRGRGRPAARR